ncbi:sugar phosphate isomerase/epimerase family protein [Arthrobacter sp. MMS18-M83]|uniref:sugar phosphate isomerase/epimerase family protein n=1 Tax=Arthrobacter sp. MMS18-M83 TaxID=2996261 RepID=UPI00227C55C7|nr:sugar phosphate isomerase/epimerase family protein [Arthrobacter sp. MMS18-M83]WAH96352.1 sugar phosphate isomerase/epimerase [Arthrobacter sp. MMS18-M83]
MTVKQTQWTLSGFGDEISPDPLIQVAVLQALGANHIEVRSAWGTNIVELSEEDLTRLDQILREQGMGVSAIASPIGKVDVTIPVTVELDRLRKAIHAAKVLGTRYIRIFSFYRAEGTGPEEVRDAVMDRMRALAAEAQAHDVVLLHENEKDIYGDTPERVLDIITTVHSPALRVAWDAANFVQVGVKPFSEAYDMLRPYLEYLQVKDARADDRLVMPAGEGDGELRETIKALKEDGFEGFASLEPHLANAHHLGGFSGPTAFGVAGRAFNRLLEEAGVGTK